MSIQLVKDKCIEVFAKAKELYGVDCSVATISFNLRGRAAGLAGRRGLRGGPMTYELHFNRDLIERELECMLNDVVPHEIAHIVCFMNPRLGDNHDYGWQRVCRALGGSGERTHKMKVVYGNGKTYEYISTTGKPIRVSEQRHKVIQQGRPLSYRNGLGILNKQCAYTIVGVSGQSLSNPISGNSATASVQNVQQTPAPVKRLIVPTAAPVAGERKADVARRLILAGHQKNISVDVVIMQIMEANGHTKALAKAYYKANAPKVGVPCPF